MPGKTIPGDFPCAGNAPKKINICRRKKGSTGKSLYISGVLFRREKYLFRREKRFIFFKLNVRKTFAGVILRREK